MLAVLASIIFYNRYGDGIEMLYYDELFSIIPDKEKYIIYFGNVRKAIRLSYSNMYLFKVIVENQASMSLIDMCKKYKVKEEIYNQFVSEMITCGVFFKSSDELRSSFFGYKLDKNVIDLKIAYLHITQRCNLDCYYCYNKKNLNNSNKELTLNEWKDAIKKLYLAGVRKFVITGGEPLIRTDLIDIIAAIPSGCQTTLLSNGTLLEGDKTRVFDYVDEAIISIDSMQTDNNDNNRRYSKQYNALACVEKLDTSQKQKTTIRSVATKNNYGDLSSFTNYVTKTIGIKHLIAEYLPNTPDEYGEFYPVMKEEYVHLKISDLVACGAGKSEIAVDSNGDIYPCQSLIKPNFKLGNIKKSSWEKDMCSSVKKMQIKDVNTIEKCRDCVYKYMCGNGCRAIVFNIYNEINRCNDFMCEYYKQKAIENIKNLFVKGE